MRETEANTVEGDSDASLVLGSPAFWVGTLLLLGWGLAVVFVFKMHGPCDGQGLCELGLLYWLLIGILPGAYLIAGLLAPARPFLTGLALAAVQLVVAAATALIPDHPVESGTIDIGSVVLAAFAVGLVVGIVVTGIVGHITRWTYQQARARARGE